MSSIRLYPAIDLKNGKCVRLMKGDMNAAKVYNESAAAQAKEFVKAGFDYLHVVDLDGAVSGSSVNHEAVKEILASVTIPVQLGGGLRDRAAVERWLAAGVSRVVLGTAAVKNPAFVNEVARDFPGKIAVSIDARGDRVAVEGWVEASTMKVVDLAKKFEYAGVSAIIYTDISRDGTMEGPNLEETAALAEAVAIPVILSGGVGTMKDLKAIKARASRGIEGVILGRALYENAITPKEALKLMRN